MVMAQDKPCLNINIFALLGCTMRKRVLGHTQEAKIQISRRIRGIWSSANRIIGYYRMYEWRAKARMLLCACAFCPCSKALFFAWHGPYIFAYAQRYVFLWCGSSMNYMWKVSNKSDILLRVSKRLEICTAKHILNRLKRHAIYGREICIKC